MHHQRMDVLQVLRSWKESWPPLFDRVDSQEGCFSLAVFMSHVTVTSSSILHIDHVVGKRLRGSCLEVA